MSWSTPCAHAAGPRRSRPAPRRRPPGPRSSGSSSAARRCRPRRRRRGSGAACGSTATPGRSSRKKAVLLRMNGRWQREVADRHLLAERRSPRSSPAGTGRATEASAVKLVSRFTNSEACSSATGATSSAARAERRGRSGRGRVSRVGQVAGDRLEVARAAARTASIAMLRSWPRPGEAAAEAVERVARADARLRVEHVEQVVELHHLGPRLAQRDRGARPQARAGPRPGVSSMYLRPSDERGRTQQRRVGRERLDAPCRASSSPARRSMPSSRLLRLDLRR